MLIIKKEALDEVLSLIQIGLYAIWNANYGTKSFRKGRQSKHAPLYPEEAQYSSSIRQTEKLLFWIFKVIIFTT